MLSALNSMSLYVPFYDFVLEIIATPISVSVQIFITGTIFPCRCLRVNRIQTSAAACTQLSLALCMRVNRNVSLIYDSSYLRLSRHVLYQCSMLKSSYLFLSQGALQQCSMFKSSNLRPSQHVLYHCSIYESIYLRQSRNVLQHCSLYETRYLRPSRHVLQHCSMYVS